MLMQFIQVGRISTVPENTVEQPFWTTTGHKAFSRSGNLSGTVHVEGRGGAAEGRGSNKYTSRRTRTQRVLRTVMGDTSLNHNSNS